MEEDLKPWTPRIEFQEGRVIGILDMDAFELQIYLKLKYPSNWLHLYNTKPAVLVQANGGVLLSLNYIAKKQGLSRRLRLREAQGRIPDLLVLRKDVDDGKAETQNLSRTSQKVFSTIELFKSQNNYRFILERASNDEFFFDLTEDVHTFLKDNTEEDITTDSLGPNTHLEGRSRRVTGSGILYKLKNIQSNIEYTNERMLIVGATIMESLRQFIYDNTDSLSSSCGLGSNKLLAKLAVSAHKPSGVTILPDYGLFRFSRQIAIDSIPGLQSEMGRMVLARTRKHLKKDNVSMYHLHNLRKDQLFRCLQCGPIYGRRIFRLVNGECSEPVVPKDKPANVSSSRQLPTRGFQQRIHIRDTASVNQLIKDESNVISKKLVFDNKNHKRVAKSINAKFQFKKGILPISIRITEFDFTNSETIFSKLRDEFSSKAVEVVGNPFIIRVELKASFSTD